MLFYSKHDGSSSSSKPGEFISKVARLHRNVRNVRLFFIVECFKTFYVFFKKYIYNILFVCFPQSVVERVSSLPLVSSTYDLMSTVYSNTKSTHPYFRTVCEVAEVGVRSVSSVVLITASPIINKLEPQRKKHLF